LIGKSGTIINSMREETGANIRVLPREALPLCAMEGDELVQIVGEITKVRAALQNVSARLRANPARERSTNGRQPLGANVAHRDAHRDALRNAPHALMGVHHAGHIGLGLANQVAHQQHQITLQAPPPGTDLHYRLLCPSIRTGSLIGRGGSVIRALREEYGARIRIGNKRYSIVPMSPS
jgi:poly(rC)-binding protein 2/3/4